MTVEEKPLHENLQKLETEQRKAQGEMEGAMA